MGSRDYEPRPGGVYYNHALHPQEGHSTFGKHVHSAPAHAHASPHHRHAVQASLARIRPHSVLAPLSALCAQHILVFAPQARRLTVWCSTWCRVGRRAARR